MIDYSVIEIFQNSYQLKTLYGKIDQIEAKQKKKTESAKKKKELIESSDDEWDTSDPPWMPPKTHVPLGNTEKEVLDLPLSKKIKFGSSGE